MKHVSEDSKYVVEVLPNNKCRVSEIPEPGDGYKLVSDGSKDFKTKRDDDVYDRGAWGPAHGYTVSRPVRRRIHHDYKMSRKDGTLFVYGFDPDANLGLEPDWVRLQSDREGRTFAGYVYPDDTVRVAPISRFGSRVGDKWVDAIAIRFK